MPSYGCVCALNLLLLRFDICAGSFYGKVRYGGRIISCQMKCEISCQIIHIYHYFMPARMHPRG